MKVPNKYIKETKKEKVSDEMLKKDLALSYILYEFSRDIKNNNNSPFNKLIFKGGTLLSKSHLNYHRISEDLDFTFYYNATLNKKTKNQKKEKIKEYIKKELFPKIKEISKKYSFSFDESFSPPGPQNYVQFYIYLDQEDQIPIKIEINFSEELSYEVQETSLTNLSPSSNQLPFPLGEIKLPSYHIHEIILEKIRAILTRIEVHERDVFDLFLLGLEGYPFDNFRDENIKNKIEQGMRFKNNKKQEIERIQKIDEKLKILEKDLEREISEMVLVEYNSEEYRKFFKKLKEFLNNLEFKDLN